jgi:uncharacterized membrane protein YbhN (UPF0104 family)
MDDVRWVMDALQEFFSQLAAVSWVPVALAVVLFGVRLAARARAWQNIVRAAYPGVRVAYSSTFGSYVAGVGVNAIAPARAGDVLKLYLLRHRVEGSSYPTLASTLVVETLFDAVVATVLVLVAAMLGLLPGAPDLPMLPAFDWSFVVEHPRITAVLGSILAAAAILGLTWASHHVRSFWEDVREGFVILHDRRAFVTGVISWQLVSWIARFASVALFLRAFHLGVTFRTALAVVVVQSLSTLLPFTPGGLGTQQAVLVFVLNGTAAASAVLSFSVGMHAVTVAASVLLGFAAIGLMLRTFRWRRHVADLGDAAVRSEPAPGPSRTGAPG